MILNLTAELNETAPLPPGRIQEVLSVLTSLESLAELNQLQVDSLSDEVMAMHAKTTPSHMSHLCSWSLSVSHTWSVFCRKFKA